MNSTRTRILTAIVMPVLLFLTACGVNSIPTAEENAKAKWADVQSQYQRRADLVPNLVSTVRAAAAQERNVLREVTEARASATRITVTPEQLTDPNAMRAFSEAQGRLTLSLQRLQEAYPELHTNQNYVTLMSQLEGTENRITVARRDYNQAVQDYNTTIRTFPAVIGARVIYGSQPMQPFQAEENAQHAPTVDFGNGQ
ncbi:MAG: LemA family protein [Sphingomonadaceae bacterium]|nr:LemA family protein [Sphingomonadaceae bacterium]